MGIDNISGLAGTITDDGVQLAGGANLNSQIVKKINEVITDASEMTLSGATITSGLTANVVTVTGSLTAINATIASGLTTGTLTVTGGIDVSIVKVNVVNATGSTLVAGDVVVYDSDSTAATGEVVYCNGAGESEVAGVIAEDIGPGITGKCCILGVADIAVEDVNISVGDTLQTSTTDGKGEPGIKSPFAKAREKKTSGDAKATIKGLVSLM